MRNRFFCTVLLYGLSCMFVRAVGEGGHAFAEVKDSIKPGADSVSSVVEPVRKTRNPLKWIGRYLSNTNKHEDRPFDFSMLIGPSYSAATSAGLGATASGLYSWDRSDPLLPKSNVSVYANASLSGMLAVGLRGNNFLPHQRYRFDYQLSFYTFPGKFWGIGYENGTSDANKSDYERVKLQV